MQQSELRKGAGKCSLRTFARFFAWALIALFIGAFSVVGFTRPNYTALKKQGDEIREQVEDYHRNHETYPLNPEADGIELPVTQYGKWQYELWVDGALILDGDVVENPGRTSFRLKLRSKGQPGALLDPYFLLCWWRHGGRAGWDLSTTPDC